MTVIAGVDVGNATTEVVLTSGGKILAAGRVPTRGRKGSADSLRGAAALVRRVERQAGCTVAEARIAPLRAVDTSLVTVPDTVPPRGRLRVLAAGVATPGGTGACVGPPLLLTGPGRSSASSRLVPVGSPLVAVVPPGLRYDEAAARLRDLLAAGTPVGAVLVAGDEGVLVANRLPGDLPVIDQVDAAAAAACQLLAVEVRPPGHTLSLLTDPVALAARLGLADHEAGDAVALGRALADHANAVVGLLPAPGGAVSASAAPASAVSASAAPGSAVSDRCRASAMEPTPCRARGTGAGRAVGPDGGRRAAAAAGRVRASARLAGRCRAGVRRRPRLTTCSRWTWPPRPTPRPPGRAVPAGRCSSRR